MSLKTTGERNPWFDNVKLVLITLVVIGHFLEVFYLNNAHAMQAFRFIYAFHIPAFVFLVGFYARPHNPANILESAKKLLVPFVLLSIVFEVGHFAFMGEISRYAGRFSPYWLLWFVFCLFIWTVTLPYVLALRFPMAVLVVLSLAVGLVDEVGYALSLSRTIVFFPFFLLGYLFAEAKLQESRPFRIPFFIFPALVIIATMLPVLDALHVSRLMLFGSFGYSASGVNWDQGLIMRAALLILSTLGIFSVLILVPRTENRFTALGRNSITVYLFHGFFVRAFEYFGGAALKEMQGFSVLIISVVAGLLITLLLSTMPIRIAYDRSLTAINRHVFREQAVKYTLPPPAPQ